MAEILVQRAVSPDEFTRLTAITWVARETNEELRALKADPAEAFDVGAILSIARSLNVHLTNQGNLLDMIKRLMTKLILR
ncbi:hypothetical protein JHK82_016572 [Glycine max]|nr:hypothetical protein JHK85_016988 [Glycine max]KAG5149691.1 hypothetical protein JHK82_016572 [Glycine max]